MNRYKLKYTPLGSIAILIEWPQEINKDILKNINLFRSKIALDLAEYVLDTVPAYSSLTIFFDTTKIKYSSMVKKIKEIYEIKDQQLSTPCKLWKIPVCYDKKFGIDLDLLVKSKKISVEKLIQLHSEAIYDVHFIGFLPGFLYLGGLPETLHFKRRSKPRPKIEKGAIGIAGGQTGIYPKESPGGWNIIGNSPLNFFDVNKSPPCFAKAGDKLKFISIDAKEYKDITKQVKNGTYIIESEDYG